jgi:hypothetical protein
MKRTRGLALTRVRDTVSTPQISNQAEFSAIPDETDRQIEFKESLKTVTE